MYGGVEKLLEMALSKGIGKDNLRIAVISKPIITPIINKTK
jgi:hypothetical protein